MRRTVGSVIDVPAGVGEGTGAVDLDHPGGGVPPAVGHLRTGPLAHSLEAVWKAGPFGFTGVDDKGIRCHLHRTEWSR